MAEPILSWAGGKRHILGEITRRLPPKDKFNTYYEPFFGGGAVFFDLAPSNGYINDINDRLMSFYKEIREQPEQIIGENKELDKRLEKEDKDGQEDIYYELREEFNSLRNEDGSCADTYREAVLMLFLNRTCWNALYRTNEDGEFNVPMGTKWTRMSGIEDQVRKAHKVLQDTRITSKDFTYVKNRVKENDLVFFDPPYPAESQTAQFNEYDASRFGRDKQEELRELALELDRRGAHVTITNGPSSEPIYREHEDFSRTFRIAPLRGERRINSDETQRQDLGKTEIIVTNFNPFIEQRSFDDYR